MANEVPLWSQGDNCMSPYSGDGILYRGVIKQLQRSPAGLDTALVTFDGYADSESEEVNIDKLVKVQGNTNSGVRVEGGTSHDSHFKKPFIKETCLNVTHAGFYGANQGSRDENESNQANVDNNYGNRDECQSNQVNENVKQGNQCSNQGNRVCTPPHGNSREGQRDRSNSRERSRDNSCNRNRERNATESSNERNRSRDRCSDNSSKRRYSQDRDRSGSREKRGNQSLNQEQVNQPLNQSPQNDRCLGKITSPQRGHDQNRSYSSPNSGYGSSYSRPGAPFWGGSNPNSPNKGGRGMQAAWYNSDFSSDGQTPDRSRYRRDEDSDVFLSKTLSSILRHNAKNFGFELMKGGFLYVDEILWRVHKLQHYTDADIRRIVDSNDKKRFSLETENGRLKIRANQGHSIQVEDLDLTPITSADDVPNVIHGTYLAAWALIKETGLHRMNRNHIHFAAGEPGKGGVISGMRSTCEVMINIDMEKSLKDGLKFYRSANNVILCDGDKDGVIYPCYFSAVLHRFHRHLLPYDRTICSASVNGKAATGETDSKKKRKKKVRMDKLEQTTENWDEEKLDANTKKNHDDGVTTDESSLPAAKKQHMQQSADVAKPTADSSVNDSISASRNEDSVVEEYEGWTVEPTFIKDLDQSKSFVDHLINKLPSHIAVCCIGENLGRAESEIHVIVISVHPDTYVYNLHDNKKLVTDGDLCQLLMHKDINKVFYDIGSASASLINEYDILMDGTPIWDIMMTYREVIILPDLHLEAFDEKYGFNKSTFTKWAIMNEDFGKKLTSNELDPTVVMQLMERGQLIWELFGHCRRKFTDIITRTLRKEVYPAAIPSSDNFLAEKIAKLRLERSAKGKKKREDVEGASKQQSQQQHRKGEGVSQQHKKGEGEPQQHRKREGAPQQQKKGKSGKGKKK